MEAGPGAAQLARELREIAEALGHVQAAFPRARVLGPAADVLESAAQRLTVNTEPEAVAA